MFKVKNPYISEIPEDILSHIGLGTKTHDLKAMFGDVKFVCMGGSTTRMEGFAKYLTTELDMVPEDGQLRNLAEGTDRFVMYKVGPVLSVSHGVGIASISVVFNEILKLLHHAECTADVEIFRIGTSGGIGVEAGTVVVTSKPVNDQLQEAYHLHRVGKIETFPTVLDEGLAKELMECASDFPVVYAKTMASEEFYEAQGRTDGAFCDHSDEEKMVFLNTLHETGVRNIEMEATYFGAMCKRADIKGAIACVAMLDRLKGDQTYISNEDKEEWEMRPQRLVARYIKKRL